MIMRETDPSVERELEMAIVGTHDEDVQKFTKLIAPKKITDTRGSFLIGLGELVMASILAVAGLVALAPAAVGFGSPHQLINYISGILSFLASKDPSGFVVVLIEFLLSIALLVSAFNLLRIAAANLNEAGLTRESS
jgi:hypothetical protein